MQYLILVKRYLLYSTVCYLEWQWDLQKKEVIPIE